MKSFQDRIWLVLLGVAVAILVTLTTVYWNKPTTGSAGSDPGTGKPASQRTMAPKLGTQFLKVFKPVVPLKK